MTLAFGAAFPFAVAATRHDETVASDLGVIYAVNTTGAIAGAILAGFVFIPAAGLHGTLRIVIIAGALGSLILMIAANTRGAARVTTAALSLAVLGAGIPSAVGSLAALERRIQICRRHGGPGCPHEPDRGRAALLPRRGQRHRRCPSR